MLVDMLLLLHNRGRKAPDSSATVGDELGDIGAKIVGEVLVVLKDTVGDSVVVCIDGAKDGIPVRG